MATIRDGRTDGGLWLLRMEEGDLRIEVLPERGGNISSLRHLPLGREFLWRDPSVPRGRVLPGSSFDDRWAGGFDDLLPNDPPERGAGIDLPDHGEVWTAALEPRVEDGAIVLEGFLPVSGLRWRRRLAIEPPSTLRLDTTIANESGAPLDLLWKLHPALRISPGAKIDVPARRAEVADPVLGRFRGAFAWPPAGDAAGGGRADLVPALGPAAPAPGAEFLFLTELERGEAALVHEREGWSFRLEFPADVFSSVWVFASYGGWRGHRVLVLEPATGWPLTLAAARNGGRVKSLGPGEVLEATVRATAGRAR